MSLSITATLCGYLPAKNIVELSLFHLHLHTVIEVVRVDPIGI